MDDSQNGELKVVLLGETFVGKTCLINAYIKNNFQENLDNTISASSYCKIIEEGDKKYFLKLWDTAGQEKYRCLNKIFIKDSQIVILVYDITRKNTLKELEYWFEYSENCLGKGSAIYGVLANKIDLFDKENEIKQHYEELGLEIDYASAKEGKDFANKIGALFCETSAKDKIIGFPKFMIKLVEKYNTEKKIIKLPTIKIKNKDLKQNKKKICC